MRTREQALNPHYNNLGYASPLDHATLETLAGKVDLTPVGPILDVGCGDGRLARRHPHYEVQGVDYNRRRAEAAGAHHGDLYEYLEANTRPYGLVVFVEVLEHLEEPEYAVDLARYHGPVLATVPINMPYTAHLQVWETVDVIREALQPERISEHGGHAVLYWSQHDTP